MYKNFNYIRFLCKFLFKNSQWNIHKIIHWDFTGNTLFCKSNKNRIFTPKNNLTQDHAPFNFHAKYFCNKAKFAKILQNVKSFPAHSGKRVILFTVPAAYFSLTYPEEHCVQLTIMTPLSLADLSSSKSSKRVSGTFPAPYDCRTTPSIGGRRNERTCNNNRTICNTKYYTSTTDIV